MLGRKRIFNAEESRVKLLSGTNKMALAVCSTLGPWGKNVALAKQYNPPHVTKDGVTVANEIVLEDEIENIAVQILKEAAKKTASEAGDGTTTTILLASKLIELGFPLTQKYGNRAVVNELNKTIDLLISELHKQSIEIKSTEQLKNVALISSNGDEEISDLVSQAFELLGKDGQVLVRNGNSYSTRVELTKGLMFDKSFAALGYNKRNGEKTLLNNCNVLITDLNINDVNDVSFLINLHNLAGNQNPMVVICNDVSDIALEVLLYAFNKGQQLYVIRSPFMAQAKEEALYDMCIITGSTLVSGKAGWNLVDTEPKHLGLIDSIEVDQKNTIILPKRDAVDEDKLKDRISYYQTKISQDTEGLRANYEKRLAMLNSGSAIIYVGGSSEVDIQEKKDRIDDTVCAVRSALRKGISIGGGTTYFDLSQKLTEDNAINIMLKEVLLSPINKIKENGDLENIVIDINKVIEPTFVIEQAIRNAVQAAIMIITIGAVVIDVDNEDRFNPLNLAS